MTTFDPRLLTPPQQEEEVYPYRRAWPSLVQESIIFLVITVVVFVLFNYIGVSLPEHFNLPVALLLALTPLGLWIYFSWWQERFVPQPRQRLVIVVLVSGLLANAIGLPLVNDFLQVDRWLPLSSALNRIVGYTFTVGIVQEFLKYLIVRYIVWPDCFRIRLDGVAYSVASAVGYATILNVQFVIVNAPPPDVAVMRLFSTLAIHVAASLIVGYGLAELRFGLPSPILLTITIAIASLVVGIAIPIYAGLVNASLGIGISAPKPLFGLGFSIAILVAVAFVISFLYSSSERQAREAAIGRDE